MLTTTFSLTIFWTENLLTQIKTKVASSRKRALQIY
jgi:hypothetical protein